MTSYQAAGDSELPEPQAPIVPPEEYEPIGKSWRARYITWGEYRDTETQELQRGLDKCKREIIEALDNRLLQWLARKYFRMSI